MTPDSPKSKPLDDLAASWGIELDDESAGGDGLPELNEAEKRRALDRLHREDEDDQPPPWRLA